LPKENYPPRYSKKFLPAFNAFRNKDKYSVYGLAAMRLAIHVDDSDSLSSSLRSISTLVPIITQTLSGNPRQIKEVSHTFMLRKRLAKVANISEFNEGALAKLMALEYSEPTLFKTLYDWQVVQKGIPNEIGRMEDMGQTFHIKYGFEG